MRHRRAFFNLFKEFLNPQSDRQAIRYLFRHGGLITLEKGQSADFRNTIIEGSVFLFVHVGVVSLCYSEENNQHFDVGAADSILFIGTSGTQQPEFSVMAFEQSILFYISAADLLAGCTYHTVLTNTLSAWIYPSALSSWSKRYTILNEKSRRSRLHVFKACYPGIYANLPRHIYLSLFDI